MELKSEIGAFQWNKISEGLSDHEGEKISAWVEICDVRSPEITTPSS